MNVPLITSIAIIYWGGLIFFFFSEKKGKRITVSILTLLSVILSQETIRDSISTAFDSFKNWCSHPCMEIYSHNTIIYNACPIEIFMGIISILFLIPLFVLILVLETRANIKKEEKNEEEKILNCNNINN